MKLNFALVVLLSITNLARAESYLELGPMLGHVSTRSADIWAKASGPGILTVDVSENQDLSGATTFIGRGEKLSADRDFLQTINLGKFAPATRYYYALSIDGKRITPRPFPHFETAPPAGEPAQQRIAFSSCLGRTGDRAAAAWAQMEASSNADLVLLLGDNHYADSTGREEQSIAYFSHRKPPGFRALTSRIPVYHIWDDHDYGPNDSDGSAIGKDVSLATFKDFCPNPGYGEADNPGIYYKFSRAEIDFFMLDVRYHRSPDRMIDDGSKTMLGDKQLVWLKRELKASTAKVKIIGSGSEFQTHGHTDSWTSYPRERDDLFHFIEKENITGILLLSGDRHFTAGYQIGGKLIEITAGPMGSKNFPTKNLPDMFLSANEGKLFCVLDIDTTPAQPKISLEVHRAGDGIVKRMDLPWKAVLGNAALETMPVEARPKKADYQKPFEPAIESGDQ